MQIVFNFTKKFLSTPSARRATLHRPSKALRTRLISIHALREEGDITGSLGYVNDAIFLSTPSARRATPLQVISLAD